MQLNLGPLTSKLSPLREERGGVLVMAAVMIPVFLLLTALVVDAGTWFTHKRQLQNRADAGALAAGFEYTNVFGDCAQSADALARGVAAAQIEDAARRYAGDPEVGGTLYNTELTDQARVNVEINSTSGNFDQGTSWNDPGIGGTGPCDAQPSGDDFSDAGNRWVDVKVKEVNQLSLFGAFGFDLLRNRAQARVEIFPLAAGDKFIPIAVPDQLVQQVRVHYVPYCGGVAQSPNAAEIDLEPLGIEGVSSSTTYWGIPGPVGATIDWPNVCGGGEDVQLGVEVRIAGVDPSVVDISTGTCQAIAALRYADCWTRLSNIRVYDDGTPAGEPVATWVQLDGGSEATGQCAPDAYFAKPSNTTSCNYTGSAEITFHGDVFETGGGTYTVTINGADADPVGGPPTVDDRTRTWETAGGDVENSNPGRSDVVIGWAWEDTDSAHSLPNGDRCSNRRNNPCQASGSLVAHSVFLSDGQNAGIVDLVRTTDGPAVVTGGQISNPPIHSKAKDAPNGEIFPIIGLNSSLHVGQRRILRVSGPQSNQSVDCEPNVGGQGHDFGMFAYGCSPWYGVNGAVELPPGKTAPILDQWWDPDTKECPDRNGVIAQPNSRTAPWRCVIKAPGFSPNVIADGIAAAIGNCDDPRFDPTNPDSNLNGCNRYACHSPNYYDTSDGSYKNDDRVVNIFVVPYGAYKNTGPQGSLPILNFAAFYVTGWGGQGGGGRNPCTGDEDPGESFPEESTQGGDIVGYWVREAQYGPADLTGQCEADPLRPCTPVLVR